MPWSFQELDLRLAALLPPPSEQGTIVHVCVRPALDARAFPTILHLDPVHGVVGDRWKWRTWIHLPDGRPDPRVQVAIASAPTIAMIQALSNNAHHPGDTLLVDLDLSAANLPAGTRLAVGTAVVEVSDVENDGCAKFAQRHGPDVLAWIRAPENRPRRLRGLFARIVQAGDVRVGDPIRRLGAPA